jgi:hypothetical protein
LGEKKAEENNNHVDGLRDDLIVNVCCTSAFFVDVGQKTKFKQEQPHRAQSHGK